MSHVLKSGTGSHAWCKPQLCNCLSICSSNLPSCLPRGPQLELSPPQSHCRLGRRFCKALHSSSHSVYLQDPGMQWPARSSRRTPRKCGEGNQQGLLQAVFFPCSSKTSFSSLPLASTQAQLSPSSPAEEQGRQPAETQGNPHSSPSPCVTLCQTFSWLEYPYPYHGRLD